MKILIEFYIEQYREIGKKATSKARTSKYMHKLNAKLNVLRNTHGAYGKEELAQTLHKDVKRLAQTAYYYNNKEAIHNLNTQLIPELVRLDMEMLSEEEIERIDVELLKKLK